jgi:2-dehydro-3-deoxygluconokinase
MGRRIDVATVGEALALLTGASVGPLDVQGSLLLGVGGAEANVAIGVARLGGASHWIGRLSTDSLGELIRATLRGRQVEVHAVADPFPTSLMMREQRTADYATVSYYRAQGQGSRLSMSDIPADVLTAARVVHLTGITPALSASARAMIFEVAELARGAGAVISFDVNYRSSLWPPGQARPVLRDIARVSDIVFAGRDEADLLGFAGPADRQARALRHFGPRTVIVTCGREGAYAVQDEDARYQPTFPVRAIDPVGAGDAFVAGFLADFVLGQQLAQCLDTAARCGAIVASTRGDWEGQPGRAGLGVLDRQPDYVAR